jgi:catechol 2,3-dioxygenase-like lactoylglutathione lyase family enzyme
MAPPEPEPESGPGSGPDSPPETPSGERADGAAPAYIVGVNTPKVTAYYATSYVRDMDRSRAFYQALGFVEVSEGRNELSAWASLRQDEHLVLLATTRPALEIPALPLHFYFFVDDLAAAMAALATVGCAVEHVGYPPHALGGEVKTLDPDGNTILLGQAERSANQPQFTERDPAEQFSLLREAAALVRHRAGTGRACEVPDNRGEACPEPAEVKLADSWGDTTWACIPHAEEVLMSPSGAFIASQEEQGLAAFLDSRRKR